MPIVEKLEIPNKNQKEGLLKFHHSEGTHGFMCLSRYVFFHEKCIHMNMYFCINGII